MVKAYGRLIGSKNKKTKKTKKAPQKKLTQYLVLYTGWEKEAQSDTTRVVSTLFGEELLKQTLEVYSKEELEENVSVYKAQMVKVELVTTLKVS